MTKKSYLLDTNILLHDANSIFNFEENEVILPLPVIEELDSFKKDGNENGRNARQVSRELDRLRQTGILTNGGVKLDNGGRLRVVVTRSDCLEQLPQELRTPIADHQILSLAVQEKHRSDGPVVLVTRYNLRIKATPWGFRPKITKPIRYQLLIFTAACRHWTCPVVRLTVFFKNRG